ncbi:MAG: SDR family NAD(P)-dependent oxidoreductase [Methanobacteriota archaeon]|nr:MAG: SDR family NAD(P)-dependent oxidoreductase [Euryarchaeota archaeon]
MKPERVAVITGGAGGIGQAIARLLWEKGYRLALTDINVVALRRVSLTFSDISEKVLLLEHDVRQVTNWKTIIDEILQHHSRIDVLINNAGIVEPGYLEDLSPEKIHQQIEVNLLGTILGCQMILPYFKQRGEGQIINIASLGGIVPMPGEAVYSATKFGIRGFSLSLRAELMGSGVTVSVVCPDSVETDQLRYELEHEEALLSFVNKPLSPEMVAKAVWKTIQSRRAETLVPALDGFFTRLAMSVPALFFHFLPCLKRLARRRRKSLLFRENLQEWEGRHAKSS